MQKVFFVTVLAFLVLASLSVSEAQVMTSGNYEIQSDSVNFGGGYSTSTNYVLESTGGEVATGESSSSNYQLRAGYQQMQEVFLSLTGAQNVTMTPDIPGIGGGTANGSTTVTATSDSPSGYQLTIEASASPAMSSGANTIADYVPQADPDPDRVFTTGSADAHLAYSPFGADVVQKFQTDGATCNVSSSASSTACWEGLSTTAETVAQDTGPNQPDGATTTIYFTVGVGSSVVQPSGAYIATTTLTLLSL